MMSFPDIRMKSLPSVTDPGNLHMACIRTPNASTASQPKWGVRSLVVGA